MQMVKSDAQIATKNNMAPLGEAPIAEQAVE